ncbi:MAG: DUF4349 domain-containing protein [Phycisphaeraceae bacterium]|nr:MAG: DUF4349 domain-containing protein [Phycisphaeraceae bacterium]
MSGYTEQELREALERETRWEGDAPGLWRRALEHAGTETDRSGGSQRGADRTERRWRLKPIASLAALLTLTALGAVVYYGAAPRGSGSAAQSEVQSHSFRDGSAVSTPSREFAQPATSVPGFPRPPAPPREVSGAATDRVVVRSATIDLIVDDVSTAHHHVVGMLSEAGGEYVQESALTGNDRQARARITLRITSERLEHFLADLRGVGDVQSERISGEDVTGRVVDVEARLRNEQRIERELLELLDTRTDAPLSDIMEVRQQLRTVRLEIERLRTEQERLHGLAALARVQVVLSPRVEEEPDEADEGLVAMLGDAIGGAWSDGVEFLVTLAALFVRVVVGGLPLWLASVAIWVWWTHRWRIAPV